MKISNLKVSLILFLFQDSISKALKYKFFVFGSNARVLGFSLGGQNLQNHSSLPRETFYNAKSINCTFDYFIKKYKIDTNITLKEISKSPDIHPSYLSREFSKYFEDQSFGEYIRKQRIEKAVELMQSPGYWLTEIAYLTGFSDQSHFSRIFQKHTGESPLAYRKKLSKK